MTNNHNSGQGEGCDKDSPTPQLEPSKPGKAVPRRNQNLRLALHGRWKVAVPHTTHQEVLDKNPNYCITIILNRISELRAGNSRAAWKP